jgi:hypothetical protein
MTTTNGEKTAYQRGREAFRSGENYEDIPEGLTLEDQKAWEYGFDDEAEATFTEMEETFTDDDDTIH